MSATALEKVLASPKLPTLPAVAVKLLQLTRDPDVELGDIAELVQYDQALSAKILKTVNSSYYSLRQPCPTIKRALAYLGLSTVKSLVLGFSLVDMTRHSASGFDLLDYWRRCVYSAAAARRIAMVTGTCDPDEAFIAALMQDIGMLAMHSVLGDEYDDLIKETAGNHLMVPYSETSSLGFNHAEVGAKLGERWNLPEQIVDPIRQHHSRNSPFGRQSPLVNAVILAFRISNLVSARDRKPVLDMVSAMSLSIFHLAPEDERKILLATTEDARELSDLLDVHVGDLPDLDSLLVDSNDDLIPQPSNGQSVIDGSTGQADAMIDTTTGVGNRAHFDQELARLFEQAHRSDGCLGVVMVDADRFKSLKDTVGQMAAETALQAIAHRLRESLGDATIVCRTGAAQFGVIAPDTSRLETARLAERARRHIEREYVDLRDTGSDIEAVPVSASFGVAALEPRLAKMIHEPKRLASLAEQALFAAKQSGRNCVRVFKPRESASDAA
jgi:diguanylate cyclase (GGDEF)-like protein